MPGRAKRVGLGGRAGTFTGHKIALSSANVMGQNAWVVPEKVVGLEIRDISFMASLLQHVSSRRLSLLSASPLSTSSSLSSRSLPYPISIAFDFHWMAF